MQSTNRLHVPTGIWLASVIESENHAEHPLPSMEPLDLPEPKIYVRLLDSRHDRAGGFEPVDDFEWPEAEQGNGFQERLDKFLKDRVDEPRLQIACPCGYPLKLLRCPSFRSEEFPEGRIIIQGWPDRHPEADRTAPNCPRHGTARRVRPELVPLTYITSIDALQPAGYDKMELVLRLEKEPSCEEACDLKRTPGPDSAACAEREAKPASVFLGGLMNYVFDVAGLTHWSPDPNRSLNASCNLTNLGSAVFSIPALETKFTPKMVFLEGAQSDGWGRTLRRACGANQGTARNLQGRALLIHAQAVLNPLPTLVFVPQCFIPYQGSGSDTPVFRVAPSQLPKFSSENNRKGLEYPSRFPAVNATIATIALVEDLGGSSENQAGGEFLVREIAWRLMDARGLLFESPHELIAAQRLYSLGIPHAKPAKTTFSAAGFPHRPDFFALDRNNAVFIIEVETTADKDGKQNQEADYRREKTRRARWNPFTGKDLLTSLREVGFEW